MDACVTRHAEVRMQQRGVSAKSLDLLLQYGSRVRGSDGAEILFFDKKARRRLKKAFRKEPFDRDPKQLRSFAICRGEVVITAGKLYRRVRRS